MLDKGSRGLLLASKNIAKRIILFIAVWIVCFSIANANSSPYSDGFGEFLLSLALSILVVYVWKKISSKYLEKKETPNQNSLKNNEALESLFSDEVEEEEAEFAARLTENDTKSGK